MTKKILPYLTLAFLFLALFYVIDNYFIKQQYFSSTNSLNIDSLEESARLKNDLTLSTEITKNKPAPSPKESNTPIIDELNPTKINVQSNTGIYAQDLPDKKSNDFVNQEIIKNEPKHLSSDKNLSPQENLQYLLGESYDFFEQITKNKKPPKKYKIIDTDPYLDNQIREDVLHDEPTSMYLSSTPNSAIDLQEQLKENESFFDDIIK